MRQERHQQGELNPELVSAFAATFIPRWDTYSFQRPNGSYQRAGTWESYSDKSGCEQPRLQPTPLTQAHIEAHLRGYITLGAYMLAPDSTTDKVCLDADDEAAFAGLQQIARDLDAQGIPCLLELSRRGGHLWLFTPQMRGTDARRFGKALRQRYGLDTVELYPKQDRLTHAAPVGSQVRLPLGLHRAAQPYPQRFPLVAPDLTPLASSVRGYLPLLAYPARVPQCFIDQVLAQVPESDIPQFPPPAKTVRLSPDLKPSEKIKRRISTQAWISQYVELTERGKGYCPFHDDQEMSFSVNREADYWQCFACEIGGDLIHFHTQWRKTQGQSADFGTVVKDMLTLLGL